MEPQQEDAPRKDIGARDNVLAGSIDRVNLERAIESLPPGYRIIFVLHDIEGYEHNEIAEMMGCSIGNSKSQLHKARMKLRELLKTQQSRKGRGAAEGDPRKVRGGREEQMTCAEFQRVLPYIIDSGGNTEQRAHLESCPVCGDLVADLKYIAEVAKLLVPMEDPPERVWDRIQRDLEREGLAARSTGPRGRVLGFQ